VCCIKRKGVEKESRYSSVAGGPVGGPLGSEREYTPAKGRAGEQGSKGGGRTHHPCVGRKKLSRNKHSEIYSRSLLQKRPGALSSKKTAGGGVCKKLHSLAIAGKC